MMAGMNAGIKLPRFWDCNIFSAGRVFWAAGRKYLPVSSIQLVAGTFCVMEDEVNIEENVSHDPCHWGFAVKENQLIVV